jgi:hypothetical protein
VYCAAPDALMMMLSPAQMPVSGEVATRGSGITVTNTLSVALQPLLVPVT